MTNKTTSTAPVVEKLVKLIDVKSIITMALTFALIAVVIYRMDIPESTFGLFSNAVMLCLGFFFGKNTKTDAVIAEVSRKENSTIGD